MTLFSRLTLQFFLLGSSFVSFGYTVRVLLYEQPMISDDAISISSSHGIHIVDPQVRQKSKKSYKKLIVTCQNSVLYVNGKRCPLTRFYAEPVQGALLFAGNHFSGRICVELYRKKLLVINVVDLEDYIYAVLRTESWPGWPVEVNKVLAIVCRTYALAKIIEAQKSKKPYHLKNTNEHQTYEGLHKRKYLKEAVESTRHLFVAHNKKPIVAMYDSCCGGVVPSLMKGFNFAHAPYLARSYPCTFCSEFAIFNWTVHYSAKELVQLAQRFKRSCAKVVDVVVDACDSAGLVQRLALKGEKSDVMLVGGRVYSQLKKIKSRCFTVAREGKGYTFRGKGYGHHVGLCQWGVRELISRGWSTEKILTFYYPKTNLMKLKCSDISVHA